MKLTRPLVFSLVLIASSHAWGASLIAKYNPANHSTAIYLDGGVQNGSFETIDFKATAVAPTVFANQSTGLISFAQALPPGEDATYPNRLLGADPLDISGGLGLFQIGIVNIQSQLSFVAGSPFATINTATQPGGKLFLANLDLPSDRLAYVQVNVVLSRQGTWVAELSHVLTIPEPSAFAIAATSLFALSAIRRRRWTLGVAC